MTKGYIILARDKSERYGGEPLSYGREDEPAPDRLLKRGRATVFSDSSAADTALTKTFLDADKDGLKWHKMLHFDFVELV
jgi:hypothetical protein